MFGTSGALELGYANSAILIALLLSLTHSGQLSTKDVEKILSDGVNFLAPQRHSDPIKRAIELIEKQIKPRLLVE